MRGTSRSLPRLDCAVPADALPRWAGARRGVRRIWREGHNIARRTAFSPIPSCESTPPSPAPARPPILQVPDAKTSQPFRHEALLYEGLDQLVERTVPLIREALEAEQPVAFAMLAAKNDAVREELGDDAGAVRFFDMAELGRNPARIIPALHSFTAEQAPPGRRPVGIGEPIWSGRSSHELVECQLHEALINVAFAPEDPYQIVCAYDVAALDPAIVHEARCTHPHVIDNGADPVSREYRGALDVASPFDIALPRPAARPAVLSFDYDTLGDVRELVLRHAERVGLGPTRTDNLVIAAHELAANSVRHGGGNGILRVWQEEDLLVCEVKDRGHITDPLVGRRLPSMEEAGGLGLWIVNQVCDLVQIRSSATTGTVVRLLMRLDGRPVVSA
ncbi:MAG: hypothetical protein AVDCRST_MAG69-1521 [uncultured Solirubrobacteraceae bacterium]|uniref:Sensor histidine kinase n=1 Tax=uncultured Solirubrobacteraceae bacterium TaxID=1162706 RepID=A0A6J4SC08_9ACTN|nr:MAG: hypothetical protein AVDCRST_MAG69-1521 [uncultured Solirubrobacteraceae bacterium]